MRISDWSSDVCASDLLARPHRGPHRQRQVPRQSRRRRPRRRPRFRLHDRRRPARRRRLRAAARQQPTAAVPARADVRVRLLNRSPAMSHVQNLLHLLIAPRQAWPQIADDRHTARELYVRQVLPLAAIGPLCSFVGLALIGIDLPLLGHYRVPLLSGIAHALVSYGLTLLGVFALAKLIDALATHFSAQPDASQALKLAAYAATQIGRAHV